MTLLSRHLELEDSSDPFIEIEDCLHDIFNYVGMHAKKSGLNKANLLIIGGAALHMNGLRDSYNDLDILVNEDRLLTYLPSSLIKAGSCQKEVEFCFHNKLAGLYDSKMFRRGGASRTESYHGVDINFSVYPKEFHLFFKLEFGKEKCLPDIQKMLMMIHPDKVVYAFNELSRSNEQWVMDDLADMLATDYAMLIHTGGACAEIQNRMESIFSRINISSDKSEDVGLILEMVSAGKDSGLNIKPKIRHSEESFNLN